MYNQETPNVFGSDMRKIVKLVAIAFLAVIGLVIVIDAFFQIDEAETGIVFTNGNFSRTENAGLHVKWPFFEKVIILQMKSFTYRKAKLPVYTKDVQSATVNVGIQFIVKPSMEIDFYRKYRNLEYFTSTIDSIIPSVLEQEYGQFDSADLVGKKNDLLFSVTKRLREVFPNSITIELVNLESLDFNNEYETAVERKMSKYQESLQKQYELTAEDLEQQKKVVAANANAAVIKSRADADAYATRINGEADAEARRKNIAVFGSVEAYNNNIQLQKWDGNLPSTVVGSSNDKMLLNLK